LNKKLTTMLAVGDVVLETTKPPERLFDLVVPVMRKGDVVVGQVEVFYTSRGSPTYVDFFYTAKPCPPQNIKALPYAGFNVATLATNHAWDSGKFGVEDTISGLRDCGIVFTGAGMNIDQARQPAIIEKNGVKFGFLAYNCVGPQGSWATADKPGCAYVRILSAFEVEVPVIGGYPTIYSFAEPRSLQGMIDDIQKLRPMCDILVVSLHKGVGFIPVKLATYEQQVSYAAIDAGADLILGHHAHILKGIELYKGKAIFHGLCNFVMAIEHGQGKDKQVQLHEEFVQGSKRRQGGPFFFERGARETQFPPPEITMTIVAKCIIEDRKISRISYLPCVINSEDQPELLKHDEKGQQVFDYMENITRGAGLNAHFEWQNDEVLIHT
jgi:hypothetical protein